MAIAGPGLPPGHDRAPDTTTSPPPARQPRWQRCAQRYFGGCFLRPWSLCQLAVERGGRWGRAIGVPGLRALNAGGSAAVFSVSCAPQGRCAAGGGYSDRRDRSQGFVVTQTG